ncbi:MAG TPA: FtsX-like permease family protein, partial [Pirellulaceae bacterium]|nr:FtsX-like permease family protein [Pirellulaceae bacterium]
VAAVQQGMDRMLGNQDAQRTLVVFQENRFCPTSSRLPQDYVRQVTKIPGVRGALPAQVWTNNCRASLDVVVVHGVPVDSLREFRKIQLIQGNWSAWSERGDAVVIGQRFAQRRKVQLGSQLTVGDMSVHVAGIFSSPYPAEEELIYSHLQFLQLRGGRQGAGLITQLEVHLDAAADPDAVAREIDATLRHGPVSTTTRRKGAFQAATVADLVDLIGYAHWLGLACVLLVLSLVGTTAVMSVQDRVQEHAVLQTLGVRPLRLCRIIVSENLLVCLVGGTVGSLLAWGVLTVSHLVVGTEGVSISIRPSVAVSVASWWISAVLGIVAGLLPAIQAARAPIVASLRQT